MAENIDGGVLGARLAAGPRRSRTLLAALVEAYREANDCSWHDARYALDEDYRAQADSRRRTARLRARAVEMAAAIRRGWKPGSHVRVVGGAPYDWERDGE